MYTVTNLVLEFFMECDTCQKTILGFIISFKTFTKDRILCGRLTTVIMQKSHTPIL